VDFQTEQEGILKIEEARGGVGVGLQSRKSGSSL